MGQGEALFDKFCGAGLEGVISKRADAKYVGARNGTWLKTKCIRRQEFVVVGWTSSDKGRGFRSLLLGVNENVMSGMVGYERATTVAECPDDAPLIPMAGPNAAPGDAVDRLSARGEQPRAPCVAIDRLAGDEVDAGAQHDHGSRHCSPSATIASR